MSHLLLFHPGHLGDMVLMAHASLGLCLPESGVDLLVRSGSKALVDTWARGRVYYLADDMLGQRVSWRSWWNWWRGQPLVEKADRVLVTMRPGRRWRTASRLLFAKKRWEVDADPGRDPRSGLFPQDCRHEVKRLRGLLECVTLDCARRTEMAAKVVKEDWPDIFGGRFGAAETEDGYCVLHVGSNHVKKELGLAFMIKLAHGLQRCHAGRIVLTGASDREVAVAEAMCRSLGEGVQNLAGKLTLTQLQGVFDRSRVVVGYDSGPVHIAAARGVPVLAIFCGTNVAQWRPVGRKDCVRVFEVDPRKVSSCDAAEDECVRFAVTEVQGIVKARREAGDAWAPADVVKGPGRVAPCR